MKIKKKYIFVFKQLFSFFSIKMFSASVSRLNFDFAKQWVRGDWMTEPVLNCGGLLLDWEIWIHLGVAVELCEQGCQPVFEGPLEYRLIVLWWRCWLLSPVGGGESTTYHPGRKCDSTLTVLVCG